MLLFRPIRVILLIAIAFAAGMVYASLTARQACTDAGGRFEGGFCERGGG